MPEFAKVIRDGGLKKISVREIVPGDIIHLEEGDRVPADARLIEAFDLWTNNVPLTGESEPQPHGPVVPQLDASGDRHAGRPPAGLSFLVRPAAGAQPPGRGGSLPPRPRRLAMARRV